MNYWNINFKTSTSESKFIFVILVLWKCGYIQCVKPGDNDRKGRPSVMTEETVQTIIEAMQIKATSATSIDSGNETDLLQQEKRPTRKGDTGTIFAEEDDPDDEDINELLEHQL